LFNYFKYALLGLFFFTIGYLSKTTIIFPKSLSGNKCKSSKNKTRIIKIRTKCNQTNNIKNKEKLIKGIIKKSKNYIPIYDSDLTFSQLYDEWDKSLGIFFERNFKKTDKMYKKYIQLRHHYRFNRDNINSLNWESHKVNGKTLFFKEYDVELKLINLKLNYYKDLKKLFGIQDFNKLLFFIKKQNNDALERARHGYENYFTAEL